MKITEFRKLIREEVRKALNEAAYDNAGGVGAFRRVVITSSKLPDIEKEIDRFFKRPEIKAQFSSVKIQKKPGVKPNTIVFDIEGVGGTTVAVKISDLTKKMDKAADIKVKSDIKKIQVT